MIQVVVYKFTYLMTNSAVPDQLASSEAQKPTDLDLHCLQRQDISGFSRTRVKLFSSSTTNVFICVPEFSMDRCNCS